MLKKNKFIYLTAVIILILGVSSSNNKVGADQNNETKKIINRLETIEGKVNGNEKSVIDLFSKREDDLKISWDFINALKNETQEVKPQIIELVSQARLIGESLKESLNSQSTSTYWIASIGVAGAILGALIGGWMTGRYSLKAIDESHQKELIRIELVQKMRIKSFLQAIHAEIESLWKSYEKAVGGFEEVDSLVPDRPIFVTIPLTQEGFAPKLVEIRT